MKSSGTREILRVVYWGMRGRYKRRNVPTCDEWMQDKQSFIDWSLSNGYRRGLQLDRRDGTQGYSPDNCRYVTRLVNARNRVKIITNFEDKTRRCRTCKVIKSLNEFYKSKGHALGRTYLCKPCKRAENISSYHKHKVKIY